MYIQKGAISILFHFADLKKNVLVMEKGKMALTTPHIYSLVINHSFSYNGLIIYVTWSLYHILHINPFTAMVNYRELWLYLPESRRPVHPWPMNKQRMEENCVSGFHHQVDTLVFLWVVVMDAMVQEIHSSLLEFMYFTTFDKVVFIRVLTQKVY